MGLRRCSIVRVGLVAAAIAGAAQAAPARGAETRVDARRDTVQLSPLRRRHRRDDAVLQHRPAHPERADGRGRPAQRRDVVVAGSNDYCARDRERLRQRLGGLLPLDRRRRDAGRTASCPGYPADTSAAGTASPAHGTCAAAGDPTQSFDRDGPPVLRLHLLQPRQADRTARCTSRRYDNDGARLCAHRARGPRHPVGRRGLFQDKINLTADQTPAPDLGQRLRRLGAVPGPGGTTTPSSSRARPTTAQTLLEADAGDAGLAGRSQFADLAVGPDGAVYVTYRVRIAHQNPTTDASGSCESTDGGASFGDPAHVATIIALRLRPVQRQRLRRLRRRARSRARRAHLLALLEPLRPWPPTRSGVHVVWNAETADGQAKVFARNSPDGTLVADARATLDSVAGRPPVLPRTSRRAGGTITVVFQDSRSDPAYSPTPAGNTAGGANSGNVVQADRRALDQRRHDLERVSSSASAGSNSDWEVARLGCARRSSATTTTSRPQADAVARLDRHPRPRARPGPARDRRRRRRRRIRRPQTCT